MDRKWILEMKKLLLLLFNYKRVIYIVTVLRAQNQSQGEVKTQADYVKDEVWTAQISLEFIEIACNDS